MDICSVMGLHINLIPMYLGVCAKGKDSKGTNVTYCGWKLHSAPPCMVEPDK